MINSPDQKLSLTDYTYMWWAEGIRNELKNEYSNRQLRAFI